MSKGAAVVQALADEDVTKPLPDTSQTALSTTVSLSLSRYRHTGRQNDNSHLPSECSLLNREIAM